MKIPYQDEIKFVRYHCGQVQDAGTGNWYEAHCGVDYFPLSNTNMTEQCGQNLNARNVENGLI